MPISPNQPGSVDNPLPVSGPLTDTELRATPVPVTIPTPTPVTDNGGSLTVDGSISVSNFPATQPISAVSLPLPTGASTAALQTQPGVDIGDVTINNTSGAAAVNIQDGGNSITVDAVSFPLPTGAATLSEQQTQTTALQIIDNLPLAQSSTTSGQSGVLDMGAVTTNAPTYVTGQTSPLSLSTSGRLRIDTTGQLITLTGTNTVAPTTAQKEDDPHSSGSNGEFILAVRNDALNTSLTTTDGDYSPIAVGPKGELFIRGTDGTNFTPTMDTVGRAGFLKIADGSGIFNGQAVVVTTSGGFGVLGIINADFSGNLQAFKSTGEIYGLVGATANSLATAGYLKIDASQRLVTVPAFSTRSDTFTTTTSGTTVDSSTNPVKTFSIQVKGTGAAASVWTVVLEGSNDNTNFTTLLSHGTATGDGITLFSGTTFTPCLYYRSRCSALTLGGASNIVVTILGVQ